jgi:membrane protease YdiL (CAAX protease family)
MLDPDWAFTPALLWLALAAVVALLVVRTLRRDRKLYQQFKRYRLTAKRQAVYRKWLLDSFLSFGLLAAVLLLLAGAYVGPLAAELAAWPVVRDIRDAAAAAPVTAAVILAVVCLAVAALTVAGVVLARRDKGVPTIGDIRAMLPRNRQELALGGAMAINAGVVEELVFRLALPAAVFGATGSDVAAVAGTVLLFGALHLYQGLGGVIGTTVVGALMMLLYATTGTILVPIALHALFDLRSMVLIPVAVYGVHRVDGRKVPLTRPLLGPESERVAAGSTPEAGPTTEASSTASTGSTAAGEPGEAAPSE